MLAAGCLKMKAAFGVRHWHVLMAFSAITIAYLTRINLSVAIVAMTDKTTANPHFQDFAWSLPQKNRVLSAFFWGYLLPQLAAGNLAEKYGSKALLSASMASCALFTVAVPFFAPFGYSVVCLLRFALGFAQGLVYPCVTVLLSKWSPPDERVNAYGIAFSGNNVGPLVSLPLSGFLASSSGGWPSVFYVSGGLAALWTLVWVVTAASTPAQHAFISAEERLFVESSMRQNCSSQTGSPSPKTPWRKIIISGPLWALLVTHLGQNWGFWTLATQVPSYISSVLKVNIKNNGLLSSLPYLAGWGTAILFSAVATYVRRKELLSKTIHRKIWNSIAEFGPACSLCLLAALRTEDLTLVTCLLVLTVALNSGVFTGFLTSHVDLSPNFCGTLMGITNSLANVASIFGPLCVGWIVTDENSKSQWGTVFYITAAIMIVGNVVYLIFGSSEVQNWNEPQQPEDENKEVSEMGNGGRGN